MDACRESPQAEFVLGLHRGKYQHVLDEFDEFIHKSDYRFASEGYGAERDVWHRAAPMVHGQTAVRSAADRWGR